MTTEFDDANKQMARAVASAAEDNYRTYRESADKAMLDLPKAQARIAELEAEIERLKAGGCARDQGTTQYCAEAADALRRLAELEAEVEHLRGHFQSQALEPAESRPGPILQPEGSPGCGSGAVRSRAVRVPDGGGGLSLDQVWSWTATMADIGAPKGAGNSECRPYLP
jgi:uncharacterized small protein (DUF1192 family)